MVARREEGLMKLEIYVNYAGRCEEAFRFYERHLGGTISMMMRHEEQPRPDLPPDFGKKILHAHLDLGNSALLGADIPGAEPMRSAYVSLTVETAEDAERIYALLSDGGQVFMKMEPTFFAARFAMLRDRFGTSWMLQARPGA
jgi:PhnB protein